MKIRCKLCGSIVEGDKKGHLIWCKCHNCAIDETEYYYRIIGEEGYYEEIEESKPENYLKRVLKEKGITQTELARKLGLWKTTINHYATGKNCRTMSLDTIVKYANALNIPVEEFVKGILEDE